MGKEPVDSPNAAASPDGQAAATTARAKRAISTNKAPPPGGAYSQAITAGGMIFISGQTPRDLSRAMVPGPFRNQARQTFENVRTVVEAAGATLADAVQVTVYLRDMATFDEMDAIYAEYFPEPRPARTTIQSDIPVPVEVDVILYAGVHQ
jgi:reactive intermediate/imine deaminase